MFLRRRGVPGGERAEEREGCHQPAEVALQVPILPPSSAGHRFVVASRGCSFTRQFQSKSPRYSPIQASSTPPRGLWVAGFPRW
jgi:hypothetical protein